MPINSKHRDYEDIYPDWEMIEDFVSGDRAVKGKGIKYLPQLSGQSTAKYNAYKERAVLYGALPRTVAALVGAVFRKEPSFVFPEKLDYLKTNANGDGVGLTELAIRLTTEVMTTGRAALLVDRPVDGGVPYITIWDADDCINWANDPKFFILEDTQLVPSEKDRYEMDVVERYRELTFNSDGYYIVNVWEQVKVKNKKQEWQIVETVMPVKNGKPIDYIPFTFITPYGTGTEVAKPPMIDMAYVSNRHYCTSADLSLAVHTTSLPTPVIAANINNDEGQYQVNLGPDTAIILPENGKATFLSYGAEGLASVENLMNRYEQMLAALGARIIDTRKTSLPETAESIRTKEAVSGAVTAAVISAVEAAIEKALRWIADWENLPTEDIKARLNRELVSPAVDANMLTSLTQALQSGAISHETYWKNLEEGGLTDPSVTYESEIARIKTEAKDPNNPTGGMTEDVPNPQQPQATNDNQEQNQDTTT